MKFAHLILAHSNVDQLERLIKQLTHDDVDIFIHIDKKTNITPFLPLNKLPNVFFVEKREKVYWGAYSIVQATINGFEAILKTKNNYDYINLLSGQDYPIQSNTTILGFLKANPNKAFMEFYPVSDIWTEAIPRVTKYHLTNYHFPGKHLLEKVMNAILPQRKLPNSLIAVGRSQWFSITGEQAKYIVNFLNKNRKIVRYFKLTWGADELIFQTILFNSPFKKNMVNNNLRYIDWSAGGVSPKTFTIKDADILLKSDKLFARKFSGELNNPLLDVIDNKNNSLENN